VPDPLALQPVLETLAKIQPLKTPIVNTGRYLQEESANRSTVSPGLPSVGYRRPVN